MVAPPPTTVPGARVTPLFSFMELLRLCLLLLLLPPATAREFLSMPALGGASAFELPIVFVRCSAGCYCCCKVFVWLPARRRAVTLELLFVLASMNGC